MRSHLLVGRGRGSFGGSLIGGHVPSPNSDIDELGAAFKLLGFKLSRREMLELIEEVDVDGGGVD